MEAVLPLRCMLTPRCHRLAQARPSRFAISLRRQPLCSTSSLRADDDASRNELARQLREERDSLDRWPTAPPDSRGPRSRQAPFTGGAARASPFDPSAPAPTDAASVASTLFPPAPAARAPTSPYGGPRPHDEQGSLAAQYGGGVGGVGGGYDDGVRGRPAHHLHVYATKHNTHLAWTDPRHRPVICVSCGSMGYRKAQRGTYDAAFHLGAYLLGRLRTQGLLRDVGDVELAFRGWGPGREAMTRILLGSEGRDIKDRVRRVVDQTRLKIKGGQRSKKPRRLG